MISYCDLVAKCLAGSGIEDDEHRHMNCGFFELKPGTKFRCRFFVRHEYCTSPKAIERKFRWILKCIEDDNEFMINNGRQHVYLGADDEH